MRKLFAVDIKRLLGNRITIFFVVVTPLILALLIAFAVAPFFFSSVRAENFTVAVWNEDDDPLTKEILQGLIESESLGGLIAVKFVDSEAEGRGAVQDGAAAFVHVPNGMQDALRGGGTSQISYYGNADMPLEDALLFETLSSGTALVSHAQHALNAMYSEALAAGVGNEDAAAVYQRTSGVFFSNVLARGELYERTDETSPLGSALPIEYYAASLLVMFTAMAALPIARMTAGDARTGLVHRQQLSGHPPAACFFSRWLAGSIFLFAQFIVLAAALTAIAGGFAWFSGNILILLLSGIVLCLFTSLAAILTGLCVRRVSLAAPAMFMAALALSLIGGLFVPSAFMPAIVRDVSHYTPFAAAMRLGISGMFDGAAGGTGIFAATIAAYIVALLPVSLRLFARRAR